MRYTLLFLFLFACKNSTSKKEKSLADTAKIEKFTPAFQYRNLLEDYVYSIAQKDINGLFGRWTLTPIAKTGGTLQDERTIQQQIGRKLYFDNNILKFDFLNDSSKIEIPKYEIMYWDEVKGGNLKGTSYFSGYRMCRKHFMMLKCSDSIYFEVIDFQEMTYYYDGRIYFLSKDE
jgi:hypothetical protein